VGQSEFHAEEMQLMIGKMYLPASPVPGAGVSSGTVGEGVSSGSVRGGISSGTVGGGGAVPRAQQASLSTSATMGDVSSAPTAS
jgi:hypothetical protein